MQKQIYIIFFAACALLAWLFRYDLHTGAGGSAHMLDRWTGGVTWIHAAEKEPVVKVEQQAPVFRDLINEMENRK